MWLAMDLPCDDASASFEAYADVVCAALDGCNHDVVLVGHSLGGNTIPLVAARRPVRHLVYLCAVVPALGRSVFDQIIGTDMMVPGWDAGLSEPDAQSRTTWVDPDCGRTLLFADCDEPTVEAAFNRLRPPARYPSTLSFSLSELYLRSLQRRPGDQPRLVEANRSQPAQRRCHRASRESFTVPVTTISPR